MEIRVQTEVMAMSATAHNATADDLMSLFNQGKQFELVRGDLRPMSPAGPTQGSLMLDVGSSLRQHVKSNGLGKAYGETGFVLSRDPDTVLAPDVAFVRRERVQSVGKIERGFFPGPPDLAIEIISPTDRYSEVEEKVLEWINAGVRMVIVIDPRRRSATVRTSHTEASLLNENDAIDGAEVVPGWRLPLAGLFED